jgi:ankyrin repeat protein
VQMFHDQFFQSTIYNMPDSHGVQVDILRNPKFGVKLLQMALGDTLKLEDSDMFLLIRNPFTGRQTRRNLASYFPPRDDKDDTISCLFRSVDLEMPPQVVALQRLLQYFICLTNNDALEDSHLFDAVNWLLEKFDRSLFTYIFDLRTTTSKIFMRKILAASVNSGDTRLVEDILHRGLDFDYRHPHPYEKNLQERCITIAVQNQDQPMLQLLCREGFPPRFYLGDKLPWIQRYLPLGTKMFRNRTHLPWNSSNLEILQTLISFNADPEGMLMGVQRGFPLVNAARSGNIGAVDMLLKAGSNVNVCVTDYLGTALQAAVYAEHLEMVKFLIKNGAEVNARYSEQHISEPWWWSITHDLCCRIRDKHPCVAIKTPIQIACQMNNMPIIELLLDHGALVDLSPLCRKTVERNIKNSMFDSAKPNDDFWRYYKTTRLTELQYSVYNKNSFLVRRLLSEGADPDSRVISNWGDTPLQMAARLDYPEIVSILMENGADVNAPLGRIDGRTALQAAAESGNIATVHLFLRRNADVNAPAGYVRGLTALQAAAGSGSIEIVRLLLLRNANVNAPAGHKRGLTALQAALMNGHSEIAELLLRSNANIHAAPSPHYGLTTIETAISGRNLPMLKILMENGTEGRDSTSAICAAAKYGWIEGVRYLLQHGSDVNSVCYGSFKNSFRKVYISPLAWSISNQDLEMINLLLESSASLELPMRPYLDDALCFALNQRCSPQIILLLCHRYTKMSLNHLHENTLSVAVTSKYDRQESAVISKIIQGAMSGLTAASHSNQVVRAWQRFLYAIDDAGETTDEDRNLIWSKILLRMGADINMRMKTKGPTGLQRALRYGKPKLAKYLLEEGAEIQVPATTFEGTPLQEAILAEEPELAYTLLERGADVNAPGSYFTALQAVARTGNINIAVELLRRGAHVAAKGDGMTAINAAAMYGREDMLQLLLEHYDGKEDLRHVCQDAAIHAEKAAHPEIAEWLQGYAVPRL